ncbi:17839_t:CDS:2, partial [Racocetra persica]
KSYTPTPLSPGDIREIPTSPLSPSRDRPLPPRLSKSLPGTPLNNSYQTSILTNELYYTTIIESYERDQIQHKQEISELHNEVVRLEKQLTTLQTESENKENKLKEAHQKLHQATREIKLLGKEKETISQELNLTNADFLEKDEEENKGLAEKQQKLFDQISRLSNDKNLHETERAESDSMSSLSTRVQSPTLDFELTLKTPKTAKSLGEELNDAILNESEKGLDTTFNNLMGEIDKQAGISPQAVQELQDQILALTQANQQQEITMRDLVQENTLMKESLTRVDNQIKDLEKSVLTLNQANLAQQEREKDLQQQLREKTYEAHSADSHRIIFDKFVRNIEEAFPLSEEQEKKLEYYERTAQEYLSVLKNNIFGGVNKLREQITTSRTEIIEVEKQRQQLLNEVEELKKEKQSLEESMDLTELQEAEIEETASLLLEDNKKLKEENETLREENLKLKAELEELKQKETEQTNNQISAEVKKEFDNLEAQIIQTLELAKDFFIKKIIELQELQVIEEQLTTCQQQKDDLQKQLDNKITELANSNLSQEQKSQQIITLASESQKQFSKINQQLSSA